ncbi:MAG: TIM barrel protein [Planctomycetia bacterium]|nr:TIM barrel protein [Planctomycetia bacterium]
MNIKLNSIEKPTNSFCKLDCNKEILKNETRKEFQIGVERRHFLKSIVAGAGILLLSKPLNGTSNQTLAQDVSETADKKKDLPDIACNQYSLNAYYQRDNKNYLEYLDEVHDCGIKGVEPIIAMADDAQQIAELLKEHQLKIQSVYAQPTLFDSEIASQEIERLLKAGEKLIDYGTKIMVVNMTPKSGKTDAELILQSKNVDLLGSELKQRGLQLALHYHITEFEFGAREFHHLLNGTNPDHLSLCFDQHWVYRSSGNSEVAVHDCTKMYGNRVCEFHLRQSRDSIWTETFEEVGDINYQDIFNDFSQKELKPHLVLEQAPENGTAHSLSAAEVLRQSVQNIRKIVSQTASYNKN